MVLLKIHTFVAFYFLHRKGHKMKNIYQTISDVMAEIGAIGKDKKNQSQGFMYRGIDAVMNALSPALVKHKLFVVPEILEQIREERTNKNGTTLIYSVCKIKYTFYAEDGSSVSAIVIGEGMDSGDKATNKAMSIAFKYACFQVFCIPTEEMVDPDAEVHELAPKTTKAEKESKSEKEPKAEKPKKTSEDIAEEKEKISESDLETLRKMINRDNISEEKLLETYKVTAAEELNKAQLTNIKQNWDKVRQKCAK